MTYFLVSFITYIFYIILKVEEGLYNLNKNKFDLKKYNKWATTKNHFLNLELLGIIVIVLNIITNIKIAEISMIIIYLILFLLKLKQKNRKLEKTTIIKAIYVIISIIYLAVFTIINKIFIYESSYLYYTIIILLGFFIYHIILISAFITSKIKKQKA